MLITPTMMMQILPQLVPPLSQVTGMLIGGKKGRDIATRGALLGTALGLADLGKSFLSPSTSTNTTSDSVSDFTKSLTIKTPRGAVDQVLNRDIAQGLPGLDTGNNNIASIYDPLDFFSRSA